jgi:hypothetical protein
MMTKGEWTKPEGWVKRRRYLRVIGIDLSEPSRSGPREDLGKMPEDYGNRSEPVRAAGTAGRYEFGTEFPLQMPGIEGFVGFFM